MAKGAGDTLGRNFAMAPKGARPIRIESPPGASGQRPAMARIFGFKPGYRHFSAFQAFVRSCLK